MMFFSLLTQGLSLSQLTFPEFADLMYFNDVEDGGKYSYNSLTLNAFGFTRPNKNHHGYWIEIKGGKVSRITEGYNASKVYDSPIFSTGNPYGITCPTLSMFQKEDTAYQETNFFIHDPVTQTYSYSMKSISDIDSLRRSLRQYIDEYSSIEDMLKKIAYVKKYTSHLYKVGPINKNHIMRNFNVKHILPLITKNTDGSFNVNIEIVDVKCDFEYYAHVFECLKQKSGSFIPSLTDGPTSKLYKLAMKSDLVSFIFDFVNEKANSAVQEAVKRINQY